jgi:hypothetical protein
LASYLLLNLLALYSAVNNNIVKMTDTDTVIFPYLYQHISLNDIIVPGKHSIIMELPLYALQAIFPYNVTTYSIVNIGLVVITLSLILYLATVIFGKKYAPLTAVLLGAVVLSSPTLTFGLLGDSYRNIQYPIGLAFIILVAQIIHNRRLSRKYIIGAVFLCLIVAANIAGDALFTISFLIPALLASLLFILREWVVKKPVLRSLAIIGTTLFLGYLIKAVASLMNLVIYYNDASFEARSIPYDHIGPSISTALRQLLDQHGSSIFGISPLIHSYAVVFFCFALLSLGLLGFALSFFPHTNNHIAKKTNSTELIIQMVALSYICVLGSYIFADQVVRTGSDGVITSADQGRYLTLLPILSVIGFIYLVTRINRKGLSNILAASGVIMMALSVPYIRNTQNARVEANSAIKNSIQNVASLTDKEKIDLIVSGYWYGATTKLFSDGKVDFASISSCNVPQPKFNIRKSWYTPDFQVDRSALVIDHYGPDKEYWECSDEQLEAIYGKPSSIKVVYGLDGHSSSPIRVWIYDYDIRTKLNLNDLHFIK